MNVISVINEECSTVTPDHKSHIASLRHLRHQRHYEFSHQVAKLPRYEVPQNSTGGR